MGNQDFQPNDMVAWSHSFSTMHASGSIVRKEAVKAFDPNAAFGVVIKAENEQGSLWSVKLEDGRTFVLTSDELVKVQ